MAANPQKQVEDQPHPSVPLVPIVSQPTTNQRRTYKYPPSLEYLRTVDRLHVKQEKETFEVFCGYESSNRFNILDSNNHLLYTALEESDSCQRNCFGSYRSLEMSIVDSQGNLVMNFSHQDYQSMQVQIPAGNVVAVVERLSYIAASFHIDDPTGKTMLCLEGPLYTGSLGGNVEFKILTADGNTQIGSINKQWGGVLQEMMTDADNFELLFPIDMNIELKASLLAAMFLIDMIYYENNR